MALFISLQWLCSVSELLNTCTYMYVLARDVIMMWLLFVHDICNIIMLTFDVIPNVHI